MAKDHPSKASEPTSPTPDAVLEPEPAPTRSHPLFGALKGLLRVMPGTDLTRPTWEDSDTAAR